jgi:hypothetical protein
MALTEDRNFSLGWSIPGGSGKSLFPARSLLTRGHGA